jgi:hypothetical protein
MTTPEPISGIFDLSTLRAPTPGDDIPFASTRPSGAMPKLAPPQLSSFPPTKIPPAVLPPPMGAPLPWSTPPTTPTGFGGQAPGPANPFMQPAAPEAGASSWGMQGTPLSQLSMPPTSGPFPTTAPSPSSPGLSLNDLAASMQGRTPSLQPPYAAPAGAPSSSYSSPFNSPPPTSPFSSQTPAQATPFSTNTPLPPRHPQGSGARTSSLVGVLGSDLFPGRGPEGPTLPPSGPPPPRSGPLASDAPSTTIDPFAAIGSGPDLRSNPGVPRAALQSAGRESPAQQSAAQQSAALQSAAQQDSARVDAARSQPTSGSRPLAEAVNFARPMPRSSSEGMRTPTPPSAVLQAFSWLTLLFACVVVVGGGAFSAWTAGIVDLDAAVLPVLEAKVGIVPPRSYTGRDDVTVDELLRAAEKARATQDLVGEGVFLKRAAETAPLDVELKDRLARVLKALGLAAHEH